RQLLVADVAGNGQKDILLATSGAVVAKEPTDVVLWKTASRGITSFAGIGDVDGDGVPDVVAASTDHVVIISLRTGAIEWVEPDGEMGTIGAVRVGDVNGDGKPDVLVVECGNCGVNSGNTGLYWSFAGGFSSAAKLGVVPASTFTGGTANSLTLIHADASSKYETLLANQSQFALLDGAGNVLAQTGALGTRIAESECTTANIDGVPGDEAVCLLDSSSAPATNQRRITVLHFDASAEPPALDVLWSRVVAPDAGGDLRWDDAVADLDGDGLFEIVASTLDPTLGVQTHVYDAISGSELVAAIPGQTVEGTAALESTKGRLILTSSGTTVTGWLFARSPTPSVNARWTEQNVGVLRYPDPAETSLQSITAQVLAVDLDGDGVSDAIMKSQLTSSVTGLVGISGAAGIAKQVASYSLPADVDLLATWLVPAITTASPQAALVRSDGLLNLLDTHLQPTAAGTPPTEVDLRVGGYYGSGAAHELYHAPRVFALGSGGAQSVIVDDSRSALLRIDGVSASWAVAPNVAWEVTQTFGPTIVPGLSGGGPAVACLAVTQPVSNPPQYRVRIVNPDGTLGWDKALSGIPLTDLAPGNFNGDAVPDLALQVGTNTDATVSTTAFSGSDGTALWVTTPVNPGGGGVYFSNISVGQYGSSTVDDVYYQGTGTFVISGTDGSQIAVGGTQNVYSMPMLLAPPGGGASQVLLNAGYWPVTLYSADLQTALWSSPDDDRPYPYGAVAQCSGTSAPVLVEGSLANPARLKLTPLSGTSLGSFTTVVLAGGQIYPNEATATAAGAFLGQLTAANVHSNLTGSGHPTAVLGSSEGWLYGVDPCAGTLDFAVQIGAAVGEAVFGDTDGDGKDEILVTAADGYLYDLKGFSILPPGYVWDTDPPAITDHDVDTITTTSQLSAKWAAVT
ncbi:MAG: FG-GAP repeat domain-containing protein, partial [Polyangiaceae bacterium]